MMRLSIICLFLIVAHGSGDLMIRSRNRTEDSTGKPIKQSSPNERRIHNAEEKVKCYDELGCFAITPEFKDKKIRSINKLPLKRKLINTRFTLYTREVQNIINDPNGLGLEVVPWAEEGWKKLNPHFDPRLAVKLVIGGFADSEKRSLWMIHLRNALLTHGPYNVIMVRWKNLGTVSQLVANARLVGAEVANLIHYLMEVYGMDPESFHIIGHGLGAHVAGYAGKRIGRLGRITGLDPSRVQFEGLGDAARLSSKDANFVDVIHSDYIGKKKNGQHGKLFPLGYSTPVGHVDFYPNGEHEYQPGCRADKKLAFASSKLVKMAFGLKYKHVQWMGYKHGCDHRRSVEWFTESLVNTNCQFVGQKCSNWRLFKDGFCNCDESPDACVIMGIEADEMFSKGLHKLKPSETSKWFLSTKSSPSYCQFQLHVVIQFSRPLLPEFPFIESTQGILKVNLKSTSGHQIDTLLPLEENRISSGQRQPYLITSDFFMGPIEKISLSWQSLESYPTITELQLQEVFVSPIVGVIGRDDHPQSDFYCPTDRESIRLSTSNTLALLPCPRNFLQNSSPAGPPLKRPLSNVNVVPKIISETVIIKG